MQFLLRALTALALAVGGVGLVSAPATAHPAAQLRAAGFCTAPGVHVVIEGRGQGTGTRTGCLPTSTRVYGDRAITGAGFALDYTMEYASVVCRVDDVPADSNCRSMPPANAYWGLFEAHGSGWVYSSTSVKGVRLEPGDSVALVWQDGGATEYPATAPGPKNQPTTSPSPSPTSKPTKTPSAKPSKTPTAKPSKTPTATPSSKPANPAAPTSEAPTAASPSAAPDSSSPAVPEAPDSPQETASDPTSPNEAETATDDPTSVAEGADDDGSSESDESGDAATSNAAASDDDRVPAALTWGVLGLLAIAVGVSAVVARRRRTG